MVPTYPRTETYSTAIKILKILVGADHGREIYRISNHLFDKGYITPAQQLTIFTTYLKEKS